MSDQAPAGPNALTRAGRLVQQRAGPDGYAAFIPAPLPPVPPLDLSGRRGGLLERASSSLGRLDGISRGIDPDRLLYMYIRKDAVLSSQIEGTQLTLAELLESENEEFPAQTSKRSRGTSARFGMACNSSTTAIRSAFV